MPLWIIEPRDPLIVRDGRPFGPDPGARARSLRFPMPSTIAGGIRNKAGLGADGVFNRALSDDVRRIRIKGPLLVELNDRGEISQWFAPAPADALALGGKEPGSLGIVQLMPLETPTGVITNMPSHLALVGMRRHDPRKPSGSAPRFWTWRSMERWLSKPGDGEYAAAELGLDGLDEDARMHVSIDAQTGTAAPGALFQTRGLEFTARGTPARRLALAATEQPPSDFNKPADPQFQHGGLAPLGGERRIAAWRRDADDAGLPPLPDDLCDQMAQDGACRVLLLTPAMFEHGFNPGWLVAARHGVTPTLVAAAVPRSLVISGWDLQAGTPKPTRRLAPAGSVYFVKLKGDVKQRRQWLEQHWMQCVSDAEQDRHDGFGLAVLGRWSGELATVER